MQLTQIQNKILAVVLSLAIFGIFVLPVQINPDNFMQDDSYFYFQVAHNIVNRFGSTFNQITPTNGYHPLWMLFNIVGLILAKSDKSVALHVVFGIQALLFLGTAIYFVKISELISSRFWIVGLSLVSAYFLSTGIFGSEAYLNALTLIIGIYFFLAASTTQEPRQWILSSIFLGLSVLARLDNIFIVSSIFAFGLLNQYRYGIRKLTTSFIIIALPFSIIVAPYLMINLAFYDHLVPISGAIKSSFPIFIGDINNLGTLGKIVVLFGILSLVLSLSFKLKESQNLLLKVLSSGVLLHAGYVVLFTNHYTFWPWYYVVGVLNIGFVIPIILELVDRTVERFLSQRIRNQVVILITTFILIGGATRGWMKALNPDSIGPFHLREKINKDRWPNEVAIWLKNNLQPQSGILVYDWPGAIAYYSDLRVLPVDGLMNDFQYNDDILKIGINQYLCNHNVDFYFGPIPVGEEENHSVEISSPLYRQPVGMIDLLEKNLVIRVRDIVKSPQEAPPFALWKLENSTICQ